MSFLQGEEEENAKKYLKQAATVAQGSKCLRAKCGSVIVKDEDVIGFGFNSPAGGLEDQRMCTQEFNIPAGNKHDRTCCMHAEQRAIMYALKHNPKKLKGSRLYFVRLNGEGGNAPSGKPYCTVCSRMVLDAGVSEFVLWHKEGIKVYDTREYNKISYKNFKN